MGNKIISLDDYLNQGREKAIEEIPRFDGFLKDDEKWLKLNEFDKSINIIVACMIGDLPNPYYEISPDVPQQSKGSDDGKN